MTQQTLEPPRRLSPPPLPGGLDARAALTSGVVSGAVFLALMLSLVPAFVGASPMEPVRWIAAIVMGKSVLTPPVTFSFGVLLVGAVVHFVLALAYAALIGALVHKMSTRAAVIAGCVAGLVLYAVNFYGFSALFPWFADARGGVPAFSHIVFGGVAALAYKALQADRAAWEPRPVG